MKVSIVGGGVIGLCTAYYLQKAGAEVTVIERNNITDGCSFGNMGYISPSHFIPRCLDIWPIHDPFAITTSSQALLPVSVTTDVIIPLNVSKPSTFVFNQNLTPARCK